MITITITLTSDALIGFFWADTDTDFNKQLLSDSDTDICHFLTY